VGTVFRRTVFTLTSDQDWAPAWASQILLDEVRRFAIPLHMFRTSPCPVLDQAVSSGEIDQGWHPNFLANSSHGKTIPEVVGYCQRHFPGATTVRSHCFSEDSFSWLALRSAGIVADSQVAAGFQAELLPIIHWTGMLRLPMYFADDVFFDLQPDLNLGAILDTLFTPGLKILSFHPTFIGCNTPSRNYHDARKPRIFPPDSQPDALIFKGRGTLIVFRELIGRRLDAGYHVESFASVVGAAMDQLKRSHDLIPPRCESRLCAIDIARGVPTPISEFRDLSWWTPPHVRWLHQPFVALALLGRHQLRGRQDCHARLLPALIRSEGRVINPRDGPVMITISRITVDAVIAALLSSTGRGRSAPQEAASAMSIRSRRASQQAPRRRVVGLSRLDSVEVQAWSPNGRFTL
jgi:hypothetical protein